VLAWRPSPAPGAAPGRPPAQSIVEADLQKVAEEALQELVVAALGEDHGIECRAVEGRPGAVLLREARDADLLVLDSPRLSKLTSPGARRLAPRLIFRSPCPVVVMPAGNDDRADLEHADTEAADAVTAPGGPIST
jgi:hypothetical protein